MLQFGERLLATLEDCSWPTLHRELDNSLWVKEEGDGAHDAEAEDQVAGSLMTYSAGKKMLLWICERSNQSVGEVSRNQVREFGCVTVVQMPRTLP